MVEQAQRTGGLHDNTDLDLLRAVASGDESALRTLYGRHGPRVLSYLIGKLGDRHLAEEVLQDVMVAVWKGAGSFRAEASVRTWLLSIARRRAISAQGRRKVNCVSLEEEMLVDSAYPSNLVERQEAVANMRVAFRRLSPDQRETLELVFYHGLTGPEAAQVLGVAPGTVKSRLYRARAALRRWLRSGEVSDAPAVE